MVTQTRILHTNFYEVYAGVHGDEVKLTNVTADTGGKISWGNKSAPEGQGWHRTRMAWAGGGRLADWAVRPLSPLPPPRRSRRSWAAPSLHLPLRRSCSLPVEKPQKEFKEVYRPLPFAALEAGPCLPSEGAWLGSGRSYTGSSGTCCRDVPKMSPGGGEGRGLLGARWPRMRLQAEEPRSESSLLPPEF